MKAWRKALSMVLSVLIAFGAFAAIPLEAFAEQEGIEYISRYWNNDKRLLVDVHGLCKEYTELRQVTENRLYEGWYVVSTDTIVPRRLYARTGGVHLIVCDGVTLTLGEGIEVGKDASLSIYTQVNNSGKICTDFNRDKLSAELKDVAIIGGGTGSADKACSTAKRLLHYMNCGDVYPAVVSHSTDARPAAEDEAALAALAGLIGYLNREDEQ